MDNTESFVDFDWTGTGRGNHVEFSRDEEPPLVKGRYLGRGINGDVNEVTCMGRVFALKQMFWKNKKEAPKLKELTVLKRLNFHHIIRIAGSYTHEKPRNTHLGLLLYPVGVCDLGDLMDDVEHLLELLDGEHSIRGVSDSPEDDFPIESIERFKSLEMLSEYRGFDSAFGPAWVYIGGAIGCIVTAVEYLHSQSVRHKDIKPGNIILTRQGPLLTDFGSSTDFSLLSSSLTNTGDRGTLRYFAPEIAEYEPSGRASDMFSLACVLLEMMSPFIRPKTPLKDCRTPDGKGSYHSNLPRVVSWIDDNIDQTIKYAFRKLLSPDPDERPTASQLCQLFVEAEDHPSAFPIFFNRCCRRIQWDGRSKPSDDSRLWIHEPDEDDKGKETDDNEEEFHASRLPYGTSSREMEVLASNMEGAWLEAEEHISRRKPSLSLDDAKTI